MSQTPHKCPACDGYGERVVVRYERSDTTAVPCRPPTVPCRACNGTGIVWSPPVWERFVPDPFPPPTPSRSLAVPAAATPP